MLRLVITLRKIVEKFKKTSLPKVSFSENFLATRLRPRERGLEGLPIFHS